MQTLWLCKKFMAMAFDNVFPFIECGSCKFTEHFLGKSQQEQPCKPQWLFKDLSLGPNEAWILRCISIVLLPKELRRRVILLLKLEDDQPQPQPRENQTFGHCVLSVLEQEKRKQEDIVLNTTVGMWWPPKRCVFTLFE